ncbi:metallophosphoesterase [Salinisphaera aquimarina]|uniref:Metallophosphoesterase n=1 Tax=Salinisphaera aquimarina TaxID=2094031 RepID=A0ABV7EMZ2_9GAMM
MRFGVIGDIHGFWDERDTAFFNDADYDMLLFVGDFARITSATPVARRLAHLTTPAWAIPGNHDGVTIPQLLAEIKNRPLVRRLGAIGMTRRVRAMQRAMTPVCLGGYSTAPLDDDLGLIVARPHAMGPDRFYYRSYLEKTFGIGDFEASTRQLCELVDRSPRDLIFLAHNGPAGLGDTPASPFGCDFAPEHGDFGDPDLRAAIAHARVTGHRVRAVLAGHMHHRSKHSGEWRETSHNDADTLYLNCARVPRIEADGAKRHHIALDVTADGVRAETLFVDNDGQIVSREAIAALD